MQSKALTVDEYVSSLPDDRKDVIQKLRKTINKNIPKWFREEMSYGMIGRVVPHTIYPDWYHCDPKLPLPFFSLASQKNNISVYNMWISTDPNILAWFQKEYAKIVPTKLDIWKSCIRLKNMDTIPYELIGELAWKISVKQRIDMYESAYKKK